MTARVRRVVRVMEYGEGCAFIKSMSWFVMLGRISVKALKDGRLQIKAPARCWNYWVETKAAVGKSAPCK